MNSDDGDDGPTMSRRRLLGLGVVAVPATILLAGTGVGVATAAADTHVVPAGAPVIQPTTGYVYFCRPTTTKDNVVRLQLTWVGHSGLRVEHNDFTTVLDPGVLSNADAAVGADGLLISHEHLDHYDVTKIAAAVDAKPGLPIWTNPSVAALLAQSGADTGAKVHVVGHGDAFEVGGVPVHVYGEWHAPIHPDVTRVRNIGFLIDGRLFHPGDAYTDPEVPVELLLIPLHGLYTKGDLQVDYIRHVKPSAVSQIHDATLDPIGQNGLDGFLAQNPAPGGPPRGPGTGAPYTRQPLGVPVPF